MITRGSCHATWAPSVARIFCGRPACCNLLMLGPPMHRHATPALPAPLGPTCCLALSSIHLHLDLRNYQWAHRRPSVSSAGIHYLFCHPRWLLSHESIVLGILLSLLAASVVCSRTHGRLPRLWCRVLWMQPLRLGLQQLAMCKPCEALLVEQPFRHVCCTLQQPRQRHLAVLHRFIGGRLVLLGLHDLNSNMQRRFRARDANRC
jgi:hypothetical protein